MLPRGAGEYQERTSTTGGRSHGGSAMVPKLNYIHSRGGQIGGDGLSSAADVDAMVEALIADPRGHLVLHFHGGLVNKALGFQIAETLSPVYSASATVGGLPIFYVWESGAWETLRNNLWELRDEKVFKNLLRKLVQYA